PPAGDLTKYTYRWFQRSVVLLERDRLTEAEPVLRKVVELNPRIWPMNLNFINLLWEQNRFAESIAASKKFVLINPSNEMGHYNLSLRLSLCPDVHLRDPALAVAEAKKALELFPLETSFPHTLGVAQYRAGDFKAAVAALERSIEVRQGGDSADFFVMAMAQLKLGNRSAARQWYD